MILINKFETKKVYFTMTPTISPVYYLFNFISNDTGNTTQMMANNLSNTSAYQSFIFVEGSTQSMNGGFILNPGTYDYEIYEMAYQNLNIGSASGVLEVGLMTVNGEGLCYSDPIDDDYLYYYL